MWKIRPVFILLLSLIVPTYVHAERITDFAAAVTVHTDNSVFVSETIHYDSEGLEKHGLLRIIRAVSAEGRRMNIDSISVVDDAGNPYMFDVERNGSSVTVKIGNPNVTFVGEKTYVIQYSATNAVTHLTDKDEIYWNVTGNSWPFSIENATAIVTPPDDAEVTASACYVGSEGSTEECARHNNTSFVAGKTLTAGEGFTIAVGFPEGIVAPYPPKTWMERNGYLFLFLLPLIIFFILFRRWKRYGKDPKGTGVIVPQYDVLDDLTPMEVALIVYQKNRNKDIAAELIYLATKGYLKIHQTQTKTFGVFKSTDYELTLLNHAQTYGMTSIARSCLIFFLVIIRGQWFHCRRLKILFFD